MQELTTTNDARVAVVVTCGKHIPESAVSGGLQRLNGRSKTLLPCRSRNGSTLDVRRNN
jgi:hypothetical protein